MSSPTPCLRPEIDVHPIQHEGKNFFVLYDTSGMSTAQLAVSPEVMFITAQLDGATSILDIQDRFARETGGQILPSEDILSIIASMEEALFLKGEAFDKALDEIRRDFLRTSTHQARSAGSAYSSDPRELGCKLDEMMNAAPPPEEPAPACTGRRPFPRGMIIPHIDFVRGSAGYGQAYSELSGCRPPRAVVILGTGHQPMTNRIALCSKDFAVPGGLLRNARAITDALRKSCMAIVDFTQDEFAHYGEHSVELQAVWLHHIWGEQITIVPVLVGSMHDFIQPGSVPHAAASDPQLAAFTVALQEIMAGEQQIMLIASADLSHIGPRFGDQREITEAFLEEVEEVDRGYLSAVMSGGPLAGLENLHQHHDRYHVCGAGCIHVLNAAMPECKGRLLGYHQAATPEMQQAVTYASVMFD